MADEKETQGGMSFFTVAILALLVCAALVGAAVFFLNGSSHMPFNYEGFDK
ncbi:MAG TPA: hypothetical protein VFF73_10375 [Planctomycetota bacterium]|jgi:dolichol kinase|nr:hypothetical protein [Planctomycetota bacterium]